MSEFCLKLIVKDFSFNKIFLYKKLSACVSMDLLFHLVSNSEIGIIRFFHWKYWKSERFLFLCVGIFLFINESNVFLSDQICFPANQITSSAHKSDMIFPWFSTLRYHLKSHHGILESLKRKMLEMNVEIFSLPEIQLPWLDLWVPSKWNK